MTHYKLWIKTDTVVNQEWFGRGWLTPNLDFEVCSHSFTYCTTRTGDLQLGLYRSVFGPKYKLILDGILDYRWTALGSGASLNTVCHRSLTSVSKMAWELSELICLKSNPRQIWLISQWKQFPAGKLMRRLTTQVLVRGGLWDLPSSLLLGQAGLSPALKQLGSVFIYPPLWLPFKSL